MICNNPESHFLVLSDFGIEMFYITSASNSSRSHPEPLFLTFILLSGKADNSWSPSPTLSSFIKLKSFLTRDALYQNLKNQVLRNVSKPLVYLRPIWSQLNLAAHGLLLGIITVRGRMQFGQHSTDLHADLVQGQIHRLR